VTLTALIATMPGEATATDADVLAWLHETVPGWQDVPWLEFAVWLHTQGLTRAALTTAATTGGTVATQTAAQHLLDCLTAGQPLSASDSRVRAIVNASGLPAGAKTALIALATTTAVRWSLSGVDWSAPMDGPETARRLHDIAGAR
jgi:hypothetical protein